MKRSEHCDNLPRANILKSESDKNVFLLATAVFLKEIVLELTERPS